LTLERRGPILLVGGRGRERREMGEKLEGVTVPPKYFGLEPPLDIRPTNSCRLKSGSTH